VGSVDIVAAKHEWSPRNRLGILEMLATEVELSPIVWKLSHEPSEEFRRPILEYRVIFQHEVALDSIHDRILDNPQVGLQASPRSASCLKVGRGQTPVARNGPHPREVSRICDAYLSKVASEAIAPVLLVGQIDHINPLKMFPQSR
jgi:hypothetical protein